MRISLTKAAATVVTAVPRMYYVSVGDSAQRYFATYISGTTS